MAPHLSEAGARSELDRTELGSGRQKLKTAKVWGLKIRSDDRNPKWSRAVGRDSQLSEQAGEATSSAPGAQTRVPGRTCH